MTKTLFPHGGQLPIVEALQRIHNGSLKDVPIPAGLTEDQIIRGIQLDGGIGKDASSQLGRLAGCCAEFCIDGRVDSDLPEDQLVKVKAVCGGPVFAGIEVDKPDEGSRTTYPARYAVALTCPSDISDDRLPCGKRDAFGAFSFGLQQVPDSTAEDITEALTPKNPDDVYHLTKHVLKNYEDGKPKEVYSHGEARYTHHYWSRGIGAELQNRIFGQREAVAKELGDDYSLNAAVDRISTDLLERITRPGSNYTARDLGIAFGHLAATFVRTDKTPREH